MAFVVKVLDGSDPYKVYWELQAAVAASRFTAGIRVEKGRVLLGGAGNLGVRLKNSKPYCGSHSGPCRVTGMKHRKARWLEGSDWIGWNNLINDVLDRMGVSANVRSSSVVIRKGGMRRVEYNSFGHGDFRKDEPDVYDDYRGKEPPETVFESGTPGIASYRLEDEVGYCHVD